jgi:cephalosporin hydroxylase
MMIHDASHEAADVYADLQAYGDLVSPGCYLIVEDGIGDVLPGFGGRRPTPGPYPATQQYLSEHPEFEVDMDRERYVMTYNPGGFLKRKG